ncbi:hypothetical protein KJY77_00165 [Canibacter sp. lx-72]|uniref:hypothetical protein n=1 Tax=Canibacter zhuwentaonis TaxID=2837491 RepID=UPI001BDDAA4D|nr:hypothetical protein [Canibacter zhuwentaonis]MBT1017562.1 hypothetical protein [Canibacter zhuwentaonis]
MSVPRGALLLCRVWALCALPAVLPVLAIHRAGSVSRAAPCRSRCAASAARAIRSRNLARFDAEC